jgi:hypothetical protein
MRGLLLSAVLLLFLTGPAAASQRLSDVDVRSPTLQVNRRGEALITYTRAGGDVRHVLAWGAVNAREPSPDTAPVEFQIDNSGGWGKERRLVWKTFKNACAPYDGPTLVWAVATCKAPDGSYWALQSWVRILPLRGIPPFKPGQGRWELHLSHWTGSLGVLQVSPNYTYGGEWQGLFGRLTYHGWAVHGYRTPSSTRADLDARYFYIDTFDSAWGPGWKRAAAKVTHNPNGGFCFSFVPDRPPPGYPDRSIRPAGNGKQHRVTVMGPGVTPDLQWVGDGLGAYDAAADARFNALFDSFLAGDKVCAPER